MTTILGPYGAAEAAYRAERIAESFRSHRRARALKGRSKGRAGKAQPPSIDWYGG